MTAKPRRDVPDLYGTVARQVAAHPAGVTHAESAAGYQIEPVRCETHEGEIRLDATFVVAELGIDAAPYGLIEAVGGDPIERCKRAGPSISNFENDV